MFSKRELFSILSRYLPRWVKILIKFFLSPRYYCKIAINDLMAYFGSIPGEVKVIFVAGYPKSGTTWVENFVSSIPGYSPRVLGGDREVIRHHELPDDAFTHLPSYAYSSIKTHINPSAQSVKVLRSAGISKILVMYRDPRDVIVSHYYHLLKDNPWQKGDPFYRDYSKLSRHEALMHSIEMTANDYLAWVKGWLDIANKQQLTCMFLQYEALRSDPLSSFHDICTHFGIIMTDKQIQSATDAVSGGRQKRLSFAVLPGQRSTLRSGSIGKWRDELDAEHVTVLKDRIGELLVELGYELDLEW
jgi:sulfotransferase 6B1